MKGGTRVARGQTIESYSYIVNAVIIRSHQEAFTCVGSTLTKFPFNL